MASISANGSRGHHQFILYVEETNVNTTNNNSTVHYNLVLNPIQNGWNWAISGVSYAIDIGGNYFSGNISSYDGSSTVSIKSGDVIIPHNNDGSKTIDYSFVIRDTAGQTYTPGNAGATGNLILTKIARYPVLTSGSNFTDESNPTLRFTNQGLYPVRVKLEAGGNSQLIIRDIPQNSTSYTFELTETERDTLRALIPSSNSLRVVETVCAMNGNIELSASYKNYTMTIVNGNPIFTNFTYQDINNDVTAVTGNNQVLVKNLSILEATIPTVNKMTAIKEATEKNYVVTIDTINQSINYDDENEIIFDLGTISTSGLQQLNVRAYDSRNNSTLVSKDIMVYDYAQPILNATVERLNNFEAQTTINIDGSFSSLVIDNLEKNTIKSVQYRYREVDGNWNNWSNVSFILNNNEFQCNSLIVSLDNTKAFDIEIKAVDNLSETVINRSIDVGKAIFFISSNLEEAYLNDKRILTEDDLESFETYTTTEEAVGIYINGETIYKKTLNIGSYSFINGDNTFTHYIDNFNKLIKLNYSMDFNAGSTSSPSYQHYVFWNKIVSELADDTNIILASSSTGSFINLDITIYYTKTTT